MFKNFNIVLKRITVNYQPTLNYFKIEIQVLQRNISIQKLKLLNRNLERYEKLFVIIKII
jgi:hypothetical protein